jgi:hypothetical protein
MLLSITYCGIAAEVPKSGKRIRIQGGGDLAPASSQHEFEFDLDKGIRAQVIEALEMSPRLPLKKGVGPAASGIYALYYKGDLVYLGKASKGTTESGRTLRDRLNEHVDKIESRENITSNDMECRYLTFTSEWWVFAAELALITHYRPLWNKSGFGAKVPGKGRPGTERVSRWDRLFPKKRQPVK